MSDNASEVINSICGPSLLDGFESDRPPEYRPPRAVRRAHDRAVRLGYTSNITAIADSTRSNQDEEYLRGILISGIVILTFFMVWMAVLLTIKCCLRGRAGIWAGRPVKWPQIIDEGEEKVAVPEESAENIKKEDEAKSSGSDKDEGEPNQAGAENEAFEGESYEKTNGDIISSTIGGLLDNDETIKGKEDPPSMPDNEETADNDDKNNTEDTEPKEFDAQDEGEKEFEGDILEKKVIMEPKVDLSTRRARAMRTMNILRCVALSCGIGVIVSCLIMVSKGIKSVENAASSTGDGLLEGDRLATQAAEIIEDYAREQAPLIIRFQKVREDFNGFCPLVRENICEVNPVNGELTENCNYVGIPYGEILQALGLPTLGNGVLLNDLDEARQDLIDLSNDLRTIEEEVDDVEWPFRVARAFALVLLSLDVLLMVCLFLAWRHDHLMLQSEETVPSSQKTPRQRCFLLLKSWGIVPLFILFVILALVFSTLFAIVSVTTSDLCVDSPDSTILVFVDSNSDSLEDLIHRFTVYYVDRCAPERRPHDLDDQLEAVRDVFAAILNLLDSIVDSRDDIQDVCGRDPSPIVESAQILLENLCLIREVIQEVLIFFSCDNWYPLYAIVAHQAVCDEAAYGFHWLATSQFFVVLFSMILLTVRAAFYDMEPEPKAAIEQKCPEGDPSPEQVAPRENQEDDNNDEVTPDEYGGEKIVEQTEQVADETVKVSYEVEISD